MVTCIQGRDTFIFKMGTGQLGVLMLFTLLLWEQLWNAIEYSYKLCIYCKAKGGVRALMHNERS